MKAVRCLLIPTLLVASIATAVGGMRTGQLQPQLSTDTGGDSALVSEVQQLAGPNRNRMVVCVIERGEQRIATFGADPATVFPIASVTKTITGTLFALSLDFGEVTRETTLGSLLPVEGDAATITLSELATHSSGLGEWGNDSADDELPWWDSTQRAGTQYNRSLEELIARAEADPLSTRGSYSYSNIGFALLGHALAAAADSDYESLVRQRVLGPWEMSQTIARTEPLPNPPSGYTDSGLPTPAWSVGAYLPAGGIYSTITDMCTYTQQLIEFSQTFPDAVDARDQITLANGSSSGLGWTQRALGDSQAAIKSGEMSGFASTIATNDSTGVVILSDTPTAVDTVAMRLLQARQ